jgi:hypothetical protein
MNTTDTRAEIAARRQERYLTSVSIDASTWDEVVDSLRNEKLKKLWEKEGAISREEGALIQLVDCASPDRLVFDSEAKKQKNERRMIDKRSYGNSLIS